MLDCCHAAIAPLGAQVSERRWMCYTTFVTAAQSARWLRDVDALKGVCVLTAVTFAWDDMDPALHSFDDFLPEIRAICDRFYSPGDADIAFEAARSFIACDHMFRESPISRALCTTSLEQYFRFRTTDIGAEFWMRMSYPIYRHEPFTEHCRSGLAARMATRGMAVVNDLYSFAKERGIGQFANCFHLCPPGTAEFREFLERLLDGVVEDLRCIQSFDRVTRDILADLIYGNFVWSRGNERYRQPVNDLNRRIA